MIELVAKRYVKALMMGKEHQQLGAVSDQLNTIKGAYGDKKFIAIISSTDVSSVQKVDLILSFIENNRSTEVENLVKLLAQKKRLDILPDIALSLNEELAILNNSYTGTIYTNKELSLDEVERLRGQFANRFSITLTLKQDVCDYDGIKVDIEGLGCEVAFSKERLKSQMIEHILKAV